MTLYKDFKKEFASIEYIESLNKRTMVVRENKGKAQARRHITLFFKTLSKIPPLIGLFPIITTQKSKNKCHIISFKSDYFRL